MAAPLPGPVAADIRSCGLEIWLFDPPEQAPLQAVRDRLQTCHIDSARWIADLAYRDQLRTDFLILLGYGPNPLTEEYEGFFKALNQTLLPVRGDCDEPPNPPQIPNSLFILRTYGDLVTLHGIITQPAGFRIIVQPQAIPIPIRNETRDTIFQLVEDCYTQQHFSSFPVNYPIHYANLIQNSIELVLWMWLMIRLQSDDVHVGAHKPLVGGRDPSPWAQGETIHQSIFSSLVPFSTLPPNLSNLPGTVLVTIREENKIKDHDREFSRLFNLSAIEDLTRIKVVWTDNLLEHLYMHTSPHDKFGQVVYIFDHSKWLRKAEVAPVDTLPLFYRELAIETLETLALLIPLEATTWYQEKAIAYRGPGGRWLCLLEDELMLPKRRVQDYQIWRHRLLALEDAFGNSSSTFWQLLKDQRINNQRWTFCVALFGFIIALLLLLLTAVLLALTGWLAHDTHKTLTDAEAAGSTGPRASTATSISNTVYSCCSAAPCCSATIFANSTMPSPASTTSSQGPATTISHPSTILYPDTYSRYDVFTGAIEYDTQYGEIYKGTDSDDITTLLNFKFSNQTSGHTCQFAFWLGSNTTHTGSQEFDIFTSNAQPIEDIDSWPYGNLRNNFVGRLMFSIVPGFARFEAGFTDEARQFPCPAEQMIGYELVGVNDEVSIRWDKTNGGPYIISQGE